jgi:hypothetical protein
MYRYLCNSLYHYDIELPTYNTINMFVSYYEFRLYRGSWAIRLMVYYIQKCTFVFRTLINYIYSFFIDTKLCNLYRLLLNVYKIL